MAAATRLDVVHSTEVLHITASRIPDMNGCKPDGPLALPRALFRIETA